MEQPATACRADRSPSGPGPAVPDALVGQARTVRVTRDEHGAVPGRNAGAERPLSCPAGQTPGRRAAHAPAEPVPVVGGLPALTGSPRRNGAVPLRHRDGRTLTVGFLAHHRPPGTDAPTSPIVSALAGGRPRTGLGTSLVSWSFTQSPCCATAVYDARLRSGLCEAVCVTEPAVGETGTDAVRHAEPPLRLWLIHDASLICEVSDGGGTAPHLRRARTSDEGGGPAPCRPVDRALGHPPQRHGQDHPGGTASATSVRSHRP
jgi:hypothetical protein